MVNGVVFNLNWFVVALVPSVLFAILHFASFSLTLLDVSYLILEHFLVDIRYFYSIGVHVFLLLFFRHWAETQLGLHGSSFP